MPSLGQLARQMLAGAAAPATTGLAELAALLRRPEASAAPAGLGALAALVRGPVPALGASAHGHPVRRRSISSQAWREREVAENRALRAAEAERQRNLPPPPLAGDSLPVVLVGCSSQKAERRLPAAELYTSPLFRRSLAYARTITDDAHIRIVSARHGLVRLDQEIDPYDMALQKLGKREREDWGGRVAGRLADIVGWKPREVVVLAGKDYVQALRSGAHGIPWSFTEPLKGLGTVERLAWLNKHVTPEVEPASSAPDPRHLPASFGPPTSLRALAVVVQARATPAPAEPLTRSAERMRIVAFLLDKARFAPATYTGREIAALLREAAATIDRARLVRLHAVDHLRAEAATTQGMPGEALFVAAKQIEAGDHLQMAPPPVEASSVVTGTGKVEVEVLARDGDLFVHADLTDPDRLTVSHAGTGRKVGDLATLDDARAYMYELNRPELRPLFDRWARGDKGAAAQLLRQLEVGAGSRIERYARFLAQNMLPPAPPEVPSAPGEAPALAIAPVAELEAGSQVRILKGQLTGRTGTVQRVCRPPFADHVYVKLDPAPRERTEKVKLLARADLAGTSLAELAAEVSTPPPNSPRSPAPPSLAELAPEVSSRPAPSSPPSAAPPSGAPAASLPPEAVPSSFAELAAEVSSRSEAPASLGELAVPSPAMAASRLVPSSVEIIEQGKRLTLESPFHPHFPGPAKRLGGRWDGKALWIFDARDAARVRELSLDVFGTDGSPISAADLWTIQAPGEVLEKLQPKSLWLAGREVASVRGRDSGARLGAGVVVLEGGFRSGGSMKHPAIVVRPGTRVEVRDVPRGMAERVHGEHHGVTLLDATGTIVAPPTTVEGPGLDEAAPQARAPSSLELAERAGEAPPSLRELAAQVSSAPSSPRPAERAAEAPPSLRELAAQVPAPSSPAEPPVEAPGLHREGERLYADSAFLRAAGRLPGHWNEHLGGGEFVLKTPLGDVDFNRWGGVDFPGQTGRSHLLEGTPAALAGLLEAMGMSTAAALPAEAEVPPASLASLAAQVSSRPVPPSSALRHAPAPAPPEAAPKPVEQTLPRPTAPALAIAPPGDKATVKWGRGDDATDKPVDVLARGDDLFIHPDLSERGRFSVSHAGTGLRAGHFGTFDEAATFMSGLNTPEIRPLLDRVIGGDKDAGPELGRLIEAGDVARLGGRILEEQSKVRLDQPLELQGEGARRTANLSAMRLAAELARAPRELTDQDRRLLAAYSGWGGLSIRAAEGKFPSGFPTPETRGLIHEYYTPSRVCAEVARVVAPLLPALAGADGRVNALEPSAGIGRFVRAFEGPGFELMRWHAVEYSAVSAAMLRAMRPELDLFEGPFERWVSDHEDEMGGSLELVVANPPYGKRGASKVEDQNPEYRLKDAYAYFLRRGLDLLAPGGLGIYLVPSGFLTGTGAKHVTLRTQVLRRHHLSAAYRLPSGSFPGAHLVTDLLFFRARDVVLEEVDAADKGILEGRYFLEYPAHILGEEVGKGGDEDDQTTKPRFGYQVRGEFTALPELRERPLCTACTHGAPVVRRKAVVRLAVASASPTLPDDRLFRLTSASSLGLRVGAFLAAVAAQESEEPLLAWEELHRALRDWAKKHGAPSLDAEVATAAKEGDLGAQRFLSAFAPRSTNLIPALETRPTWTPRYQGRADDVVARAEYLYGQRRRLARTDLGPDHVEVLFRAGWCEDGPGELMPGAVYYTGELWPKYDRARMRAEDGDPQASAQAKRLLELIKPALFDDIDVSPRQGWVPLELVEAWLATRNHGESVALVRKDGLVQLADIPYEATAGAAAEVVLVIGWINHDRDLFKPLVPKDERKRREEAAEDEDVGVSAVDELRLKVAKEWEESFRAWCGADDARRAAIEHAYTRSFQGYKVPEHSAEPLPLARWIGKVRLQPHQNRGARRVLQNRGGLIAFDVGVGKTYTGLAVVAGARQAGWCKRPIVLAPNSIVWKWYADILRALPDYRVAVIGSALKTIARGRRKGHVTSEIDTPAERAAKWSRFQGGEYDVVILTYTALPRTKMNATSVAEYADATSAIQREIALRRRTASKKRKLSERDEAILTEGTAAWVAEQLELPMGWEPDTGIYWEELGCDLLVVDEAQNFKNLYLPEPREGGVPRFMGNAGEGSKRAWQLDFRTATVRKRSGGAGVVLLSATPAKNSPLELYTAIQYVDHDAFARQGINDPEAFTDRYCELEVRPVLNSAMKVVDRSAVVGFKNLHELRTTLDKYAEFQTAEEVGIRLPTAEVRLIEVDLDTAQEEKYVRYVAKIEKALANPRAAKKGTVLEYLGRMSLVAIHANLDEGYDWTTAKTVPSPHSPKFDALAVEIMRQPSCGHIVFCDNLAAHVWVRMVLEEAGVPAGRIAVLNAEVAKASADRQRIAQEFNGNPEEGIEPSYDVVIANMIAYEGIDLQTRTCAIHHLDLPWEPATLQQRNGRGVRQGNTLAAIGINYYFARRSSDGHRFNLIQGKRGWMTALLEGQERETNNPAAQMDLNVEEVLLLISRDPEGTRERLAEVKARRKEEANRKVADQASANLRGAATRFWRARTARSPEERAVLLAEAEERLEDLGRIRADAWPWAGWAFGARDHAMLVPPGGHSPVYEGLRVGIPNANDPSVTDFREFGRVQEGKTIGWRSAGSPVWTTATMEEVIAMQLRPEQRSDAWPLDDETGVQRAMRDQYLPGLAAGRSADEAWKSLGWTHASDAFLERAWARFGQEISRGVASSGAYWGAKLPIPSVRRNALQIGFAGPVDTVMPPTRAGWEEFLRVAPSSGLKLGELEGVGEYWFGRRIPHNLLVQSKPAASTAASELRALTARSGAGLPARSAAPDGPAASAIADVRSKAALSSSGLYAESAEQHGAASRSHKAAAQANTDNPHVSMAHDKAAAAHEAAAAAHDEMDRACNVVPTAKTQAAREEESRQLAKDEERARQALTAANQQAIFAMTEAKKAASNTPETQAEGRKAIAAYKERYGLASSPAETGAVA